MLEAVASIAKQREIRVTVVGRPRKDKGVEDLVRSLALQRFVEFTGRIEDEDFARYYARATLAVVPSLYEGFGFPAGEAMAPSAVSRPTRTRITSLRIRVKVFIASSL